MTVISFSVPGKSSSCIVTYTILFHSLHSPIGFLHCLYGFFYVRRNDFLIYFTPERIGIVNHISHCQITSCIPLILRRPQPCVSYQRMSYSLCNTGSSHGYDIVYLFVLHVYMVYDVLFRVLSPYLAIVSPLYTPILLFKQTLSSL